MATIYKRRELRKLPNGATIVMYRGKRYAKWTNAKTGNTQRAQLNKAGNKIVWESPYYTIKYFDHNGQRVAILPEPCVLQVNRVLVLGGITGPWPAPANNQTSKGPRSRTPRCPLIAA